MADSLLVTSDEIIIIEGTVEENLNSSKLDVTRYPARPLRFEEFAVPAGWSDGSELVQQGDVPTGRTGHTLSILRQDGGSTLLKYWWSF